MVIYTIISPHDVMIYFMYLNDNNWNIIIIYAIITYYRYIILPPGSPPHTSLGFQTSPSDLDIPSHKFGV